MKHLWLAITAVVLFTLPLSAATDPEVLMKADRAFSADTTRRGSEGWASWFAPDGMQFDGEGKPVAGREAIRQNMRILDDPGFSLTWEPTRAEITPGGQLGYTWGRYVSRRKVNDTVRVGEGTYVSLWKLQPDGSWKVFIDLGDPDGPPRTSQVKE